MTDERPETCRAERCVICQDYAHRLGELCPPEDRCPVKAVNLGMTCRRCYDRMAGQLREIPELYALAAGELNLGTGSGGGGRSTETSIGLRVAALDLRSGTDVIGVLASWDRDWSEFYDEEPTDWTRRSRHAHDPVGATLVGICGRMKANLHRACMSHPAVDDFARELNQLHAEAKTAARTTGARAVQVDCPTDSEAGICGAPIVIAGLELVDVVYCRRCSSRWVLHRLLLVAASDATATVWLPVEDVTLLVGVPARTIKRWGKDAKVRREHGLYDLESVREAIRAGTRHAERMAE